MATSSLPGSGTSSTVTVTPVTNQSGIATITITATAGGATTTTSFALAVNPVVSTNQLVYLSLDADSGKIIAPMTVSKDPNATDGVLRILPHSESRQRHVQCGHPCCRDLHVIWCRVLASSSMSESFLVSVDGGASDIFDAAYYTASPWWQWSVVNGRNNSAPLTLNPRTFVLTSGTHTITFQTRDANVKLDRILITNDQKVSIVVTQSSS